MAAKGRVRREPSFEARRGVLDFGLSPEDRAGGAAGRAGRGNASKPGGARAAERRPEGPRRRSTLGRAFRVVVLLGLWGLIAVAGLVAYHAAQLPPIDQLSVPKRPPNIAILAGDGALIANRGETGGRSVELKELPDHLPHAFIAIEDRRFRQHWGIDPVGVARAVFMNLSGRGIPQGGSTLTQQLAKNLFLTQERTASRKIQEAILALWLERTYAKDEILALYMNRVYFGAGAYGVEAAAQRYYGKPARDVTLPEAAVLAGLVQAPSRLAPNRNPQGAQGRAELVLRAMAEQGLIGPSELKSALASPARVVRPPGAGSGNFVADYVMDVLDDFVGTIETDVAVVTTVDNTLQAAAEKALVEELALKGQRFGVEQGALVALRPDGAVRALVGGRSYQDSQFNRATTARRQPGSAFKPFVYLSAVERGLTPDAVRDDSPVTIKGWSPENFSRDYRGPITVKEALALSLNTVAVRLGQEVGPKAVVQTAQRLGISSPLQPNPSLALGTSEVTPVELVAAYAAFANGGTGVIPYVIREVRGTNGKVLYRRSGGGLGRVVDGASVAMMNQMLRETFVIGTARAGAIPGWETAGKTGTSQDFRDAWFVGYTGALVAGVWLGNDDGSPTKRVSGGNLPVEVWQRFMTVALKGERPVGLPGLKDQRRREAEPEAVAAAPPRPQRRAEPGFIERLLGMGN